VLDDDAFSTFPPELRHYQSLLLPGKILSALEAVLLEVKSVSVEVDKGSVSSCPISWKCPICETNLSNNARCCQACPLICGFRDRGMCCRESPAHALGPENAELVSSEGLIVSADPEVFQLACAIPMDQTDHRDAKVSSRLQSVAGGNCKLGKAVGGDLLI